jgi:ankyrin repeat protein
MTRSLPLRPNLESLRKEAKRVLREYRAGDSSARGLLAEHHPAHSSEPGLREVQHALARSYGFESWSALKEYVDIERVNDAELTNEFLRSACLSYGDDDWPSKWRRAERILVRYPDVARANLFTACVAGQLELVKAILSRDPGAASRKGGPQSWEPLLFVCYGRLPNAQAAEASLEIAGILLDHGADPNAKYVLGDQYHFTALTGVIGQGELGQPPHPRARELATLLLERGANAADGQGLYDEMLEGDRVEWLELLAAYGLDATSEANFAPGVRLFDFALGYAVKHAQKKRLAWLLEHAANPNANDHYNQKSAYENALLYDQPEVAALLLEHGANEVELTGRDAFVAACRRGDDGEARALAATHPEFLEDGDALCQTVGSGRVSAAKLLLEIGADPNRPNRHGVHAIHCAASVSEEMVELLVQHGADANRLSYGATATQWALGAKRPALAQAIARYAGNVLDATRSGNVELVERLLEEDPTAAILRNHVGNTALHVLPEDTEQATRIADLLQRRGADPLAKNDDGLTPAEALVKRGLDELAFELWPGPDLD